MLLDLIVGLNIELLAYVKKIDSGKNTKLGYVKIDEIVIFGDGSSEVFFDSVSEYINHDTLGYLANNHVEENATLGFKFSLEE